MSAGEVAVLAMALLLVLAGGVCLGALMLWTGADRFIKRMGWQLIVINQTVGRDDNDDGDGEPDDNDEPRPGAAEPTGTGGHPGLMTGKCRGCGLFAVGLVPARIDNVGGPDQFHIPPGTPAVCPRCWVKMNPDMATNTVSEHDLKQANDAIKAEMARYHNPVKQPSGPHPAAESPKPQDATVYIDPDRNESPPEPNLAELTQSLKKSSDNPGRDLTPEEIEHLEQLTDPGIACAECGSKRSPKFHPVRKDKTETGKFWCQACVDALGGPGRTKKPKKGRDRE